MKVVLTAPRPTSKTPSFPSAGLISACFATGISMDSPLWCGAMIAGTLRSEPTNLAHYWRRLALTLTRRYRVTVLTRSSWGIRVSTATRYVGSAHCFSGDETFAKLARCGARSDAKCFREVPAAQVAD